MAKQVEEVLEQVALVVLLRQEQEVQDLLELPILEDLEEVAGGTTVPQEMLAMQEGLMAVLEELLVLRLGALVLRLEVGQAILVVPVPRLEDQDLLDLLVLEVILS